MSLYLVFHFFLVFFFFNDTATTEIYTLSLHDALPIWTWASRSDVKNCRNMSNRLPGGQPPSICYRSEEHTSELQSHLNLVCRLLLEKKKIESSYVAGVCCRLQLCVGAFRYITVLPSEY